MKHGPEGIRLCAQSHTGFASVSPTRAAAPFASSFCVGRSSADAVTTTFGVQSTAAVGVTGGGGGGFSGVFTALLPPASDARFRSILGVPLAAPLFLRTVDVALVLRRHCAGAVDGVGLLPGTITVLADMSPRRMPLTSTDGCAGAGVLAVIAGEALGVRRTRCKERPMKHTIRSALTGLCRRSAVAVVAACDRRRPRSSAVFSAESSSVTVPGGS